MKELLIKIRWGGLGDHLFHSHLPRLAKEVYGYDKVWVSQRSNYNHPNTKRLVWDLNPFVDGFADADRPHAEFAGVAAGKNLLDAVSDFYGFHDCGMTMQEPEIYYQPLIMPSLQGTTVCNLNHFNAMGIPSHDSIKNYFAINGIQIDYQVAPFDHRKSLEDYDGERVESTLGTLLPGKLPDCGLLDGVECVHVDGLEYLCDVIHSCQAFYCVISGPATLAAAIKPATVLMVDGALPMFCHSGIHTYVNLDRGS